MFTYVMCALFAPAIAYAAAFPWSLPEPTQFVAAIDKWSPAPTAAPQLPGSELFRREQGEGGNTCGFISGSSASPITCSNTNFICATNTRYGAHGCCDPAALDACTIPTTCIPATAMSTACSDASCSSNGAIAKCTEFAMTECYRWHIVYSKTIMTQYGCTAKGFTSTALRSWGQLTSSVPNELYRTVTVIATPSNTPTLTPLSKSSKPGIGPIVGGTVGGCVVLSIVALVAFLAYRRRKIQRESISQPPITHFHAGGGMTEFSTYGFPTTTSGEDAYKAWQHQQHYGPVQRADDAMPQYPGMQHVGVVEVDGLQRPVEVPAQEIFWDRAHVRK